MKTIHSLIVLTILAAGLTSCDSSYYSEINRAATDPVAAIPRVAPFAALDGIPVQWDADVNADSYILFRQALPNGAVTQIYQGPDNTYKDTALDATLLPDTIYRYSLAKVRGEKIFPTGNASFGAFDTLKVQDPNGPNDTPAQAIEFSTYQINDHLFYFTNATATITDIDWYYTTVPPGKSIQIKITFDNDHQLLKGPVIVNTPQYGGVAKSSSETVQLNNGGNVPQKIYFSVYPNTAGPVGTAFNCDYSLLFVQMSNYAGS